MVDFFVKLYSNIKDRNNILSKIKFYSIQRLLVIIISNIVIYIHFSFTINSRQAKLERNKNNKGRLIVSLTTFPLRINRIWLVVETLLRQTYKPDIIILWLSKEQFKSIDELPKKLLKQQNRGLNIQFRDGNLKSHKKYFYAIKEFPEDYLITADDDIFYHSTMIEKLVELNRKYPASICCHRAAKVKKLNGKLLPYSQWDKINGYAAPSFDIFQTSGGGTIYPPHSLHSEVLNDLVFNKYCLNADDVWLNTMSRLNGTRTSKTDYDYCQLPLMFWRNTQLYKSNINLNGNDKQIESIRRHYINEFGIDVFFI
jgi:hypothetical protein